MPYSPLLTLPRSLRAAAMAAAVLLLAACGGGGGDTSSTPPSATLPTYNTDLSAISPGDNTNLGAGVGQPTATGTNTAQVTIRQLTSNTTTLTANTPYVTVTVCAPGTTTCQTIPDVLVDTGSAGLRLFASALNTSMLSALPTITSASGTLAACAQFASGYMWGSMRQAGVQIGGMTTTSAIPVQLMGDSALPPAPSGCTSTGGTDFSDSFAGVAKGILGISNLKYDCGTACARTANNGVYFACTTSSCTATTAAVTQQGINPIAAFATDNNGSILALPGVPLPNGAPSTTGALIFGIGTQANNTPSIGTLYPLDSSGNLSMTINGAAQSGFVDSGSNGYYLALSGVSTCYSGFYCPASAFSLAASLQQANQTYGTAQNIVIGNATTLFATRNAALPSLGGTAAVAGFVDLGLPFFYGRSIATGLEGTNASAPNGYLMY
ncbi:MAG: DUF3443 family protein [Pseudomonadota bacterium]